MLAQVPGPLEIERRRLSAIGHRALGRLCLRPRCWREPSRLSAAKSGSPLSEIDHWAVLFGPRLAADLPVRSVNEGHRSGLARDWRATLRRWSSRVTRLPFKIDRWWRLLSGWRRRLCGRRLAARFRLQAGRRRLGLASGTAGSAGPGLRHGWREQAVPQHQDSHGDRHGEHHAFVLQPLFALGLETRSWCPLPGVCASGAQGRFCWSRL